MAGRARQCLGLEVSSQGHGSWRNQAQLSEVLLARTVNPQQLKESASDNDADGTDEHEEGPHSKLTKCEVKYIRDKCSAEYDEQCANKRDGEKPTDVCSGHFFFVEYAIQPELKGRKYQPDAASEYEMALGR